VESRPSQFMFDIDRLGGEIDDLTPDVPTDTGRAAWIAARAAQAVSHISETSPHRVDAMIVEVAPDDAPGDLTGGWLDTLPPVTVKTTPDKYSDPVPAGLFRLWLEVSYDPENQDPKAEKIGAWLADMAHVYGIVPDESQEKRLRSLSSVDAVWAATRPGTLEEALDTVE